MIVKLLIGRQNTNYVDYEVWKKEYSKETFEPNFKNTVKVDRQSKSSIEKSSSYLLRFFQLQYTKEIAFNFCTTRWLIFVDKKLENCSPLNLNESICRESQNTCNIAAWSAGVYFWV